MFHQKSNEKKIFQNNGDKFLSDQMANTLARYNYLSPAIVTNAAEVVEEIQELTEATPEKAKNQFEEIINQKLKAQGLRKVSSQYQDVLPINYNPDYINTNYDIKQLTKSINKASSVRICLFGPSGTGKTTLSSNLAVYLSETKAVVLSDLDVEEPNSGLFIQGELVHEEDKYKMIPQWIEDKCTLCGICQKVCNYHAIIQLGTQILVFPELCHSCYACSELCPTDALPMQKKKMGELKHYKQKNFNFVESRIIIGEEQAVPLIKQTVEYIDEHFDDSVIKIYDSPPGTSCPVLEATKEADFVILVTEPTPFGLHDLKLAVDTMRELKKDFGVVINRFGIGDKNVEKYCEEDNIPILAKIPNSRKIAELYSNGELAYNKVPEMKTELDKIYTFLQNYKNNN